LAERITAAAADGAIQQILADLVIPARDGLALRDYLVESGGYTRLVDALLANVDHPHPRVRFLVAQAMDHFADPRCAAQCCAMLREAVPRVRWAALHSLSCEACKLVPITQNDDLVELVIALALHDPSIRVRRVAASTLGGDCYDPRAVAALEQLLAHATDAVILRGARWALGQQQRLAAGEGGPNTKRPDDKMTG
jgi:HEAT repeat protein